jgi:hypothetical protein
MSRSRLRLDCNLKKKINFFLGVQLNKTNFLELSVKILSSRQMPLFYIDASDPRDSNWLRFIRSTPDVNKYNVICMQQNQQINYFTFKEIKLGEELVTYLPGKRKKKKHALNSTYRLVDTESRQTNTASNNNNNSKTSSSNGAVSENRLKTRTLSQSFGEECDAKNIDIILLNQHAASSKTSSELQTIELNNYSFYNLDLKLIINNNNFKRRMYKCDLCNFICINEMHEEKHSQINKIKQHILSNHVELVDLASSKPAIRSFSDRLDSLREANADTSLGSIVNNLMSFLLDKIEEQIDEEEREENSAAKSHLTSTSLLQSSCQLYYSFKCYLCSNKFTSKYDLNQHLSEQHLTHLDSFKCLFCSCIFNLKLMNEFLTHLKTEHRNAILDTLLIYPIKTGQSDHLNSNRNHMLLTSQANANVHETTSDSHKNFDWHEYFTNDRKCISPINESNGNKKSEESDSEEMGGRGESSSAASSNEDKRQLDTKSPHDNQGSFLDSNDNEDKTKKPANGHKAKLSNKPKKPLKPSETNASSTISNDASNSSQIASNNNNKIANENQIIESNNTSVAPSNPTTTTTTTTTKTWTCQLCKKQFDQRVDLSKHQCIEINLKILKKKKELRKKKLRETHWKRKIDLSYIETTSLTQLSANVADNLSYCIDGTYEDLKSYAREVKDYLSTELGNESSLQMMLKCFPELGENVHGTNRSMTSLSQSAQHQLVESNLIRKGNSYFSKIHASSNAGSDNSKHELNGQDSNSLSNRNEKSSTRFKHGSELDDTVKTNQADKSSQNGDESLLSKSVYSTSPVGYFGCDPFVYLINLHWDQVIQKQCTNCSSVVKRGKYQKHLEKCLKSKHALEIEESSQHDLGSEQEIIIFEPCTGLSSEEKAIDEMSVLPDEEKEKSSNEQVVVSQQNDQTFEQHESVCAGILNEIIEKIETSSMLKAESVESMEVKMASEESKLTRADEEQRTARRRKRSAQQLIDENLSINSAVAKKRSIINEPHVEQKLCVNNQQFSSPQSASKSARLASKQENKKIIVSTLSLVTASSSQSPVQTRTFRSSSRLSNTPSEMTSPNKSPSSSSSSSLKRAVKNELTSPSTSSISSQTSISTRSQRNSHQQQQQHHQQRQNLTSDSNKELADDQDDDDQFTSKSRRSSDRIRRVREEVVAESTPKKVDESKRSTNKEMSQVKIEPIESTSRLVAESKSETVKEDKSRLRLVSVRLENNRKIHTCEKCGLEFTSANSVSRHQEKSCLRLKAINLPTTTLSKGQQKEGYIRKKCPICSAFFNNTHRLSIHIFKHHKNLLGSACKPPSNEAKRLYEIQLRKTHENLDVKEDVKEEIESDESSEDIEESYSELDESKSASFQSPNKKVTRDANEIAPANGTENRKRTKSCSTINNNHLDELSLSVTYVNASLLSQTTATDPSNSKLNSTI